MKPDAVDVEKAFVAERHVAIVRAAVVGFNSLVYLALLDPAVGSRGLALAIVAIASLYSGLVVVAEPYRRWRVLQSAYFTTVTDAALITLWLYATGGIASPFFVLWYVSLAAVAFRFRATATSVAAGVYVLSYVGLAVVTGELVPRGTDVLIRCGYVLLTAALGALMASETVRQITSKHEMRSRMEDARASERSIRELLEAAPDAFVISDREGRITLVNSQAERLFGCSRDELIGAPRGLLFALPSEAGIGSSPRHAPVEVEARRRDGATFPAEITLGALDAGGELALTAAVRDITERKRAEAERARSAESLQELNRFREIDAVKTQFINTAAHELGTPLTPIRIQLHMLKNGRRGALSDDQSRAIGILDRNVDRLATLVSDMLDAAKVQSHRLRVAPQPVRIDRLVEECVESFEDLAREARVTLSVQAEAGLTVHADPKRITQVLFNLLSNALKFTPSGGVVAIEARRDGDAALVTVKDSGIGLAPEHVAKLFKPFSQVHDTSERTRDGTGLGLYISRGILEQHGGEIWCASEGPGRGATFAFRLPIREAAGRP